MTMVMIMMTMLIMMTLLSSSNNSCIALSLRFINKSDVVDCSNYDDDDNNDDDSSSGGICDSDIHDTLAKNIKYP